MDVWYADLRTSVASVYDQLGTYAKEVHLQRALALDLIARGYLVDCEKCVSTRFLDARGNTHTISSDRIDLYVHLPDGGKVVLELKQSDTIKEDHVRQAIRYERALRAIGESPCAVAVICFPKSPSKHPIVSPVEESHASCTFAPTVFSSVSPPESNPPPPEASIV